MRPPSLESLLPGLHFALKNLLNSIPDRGNIVDWSKASLRLTRNLRSFTETGITFSTGGILMQGLRHWKANFRGFNLDSWMAIIGLPNHPPATFLSGSPFFNPKSSWPARKPSRPATYLVKWLFCPFKLAGHAPLPKCVLEVNFVFHYTHVRGFGHFGGKLGLFSLHLFPPFFHPFCLYNSSPRSGFEG